MKVKHKCTKCNHIFEKEVEHSNKSLICPECYSPSKKIK